MADTITYTALNNALAKKNYANVYLLHGDEGFYIDRLAEVFENLLPEAERDFNQYTIYAPQTESAVVAETCHRYPMMADRQVVIVKEAQAARADMLDKLVPYIKQPNPSTVLVI